AVRVAAAGCDDGHHDGDHDHDGDGPEHQPCARAAAARRGARTGRATGGRVHLLRRGSGVRVHPATVPTGSRSARADVRPGGSDGARRESVTRSTRNTAMSRKLLRHIQASVTNPSFSKYGAEHGASTEHDVLSAKLGTRSTSQW